MKKILSYILGTVLLASGCTDVKVSRSEDEPVSVTFEVSAADIVMTRAGGLENPDSPENMSDSARLIDGRLMSHLAVMVVKDSKLIACRDIKKGSADIDGNNGFIGTDGNIDPELDYAAMAKVSFLQSDLKDNDKKNLSLGKYKL